MISNFKVVLVGNSFVGKTNLIHQYIDNRFFEDSKSTIGVDFRNKQLEVNENQVQLNIWDTAGQEKFQALSKAYYKNAQVILIVYDITDWQSFQAVENWKNSVLEHSEQNQVMLYLIGNKLDLSDKRQINAQLGMEFAKNNKMVFFEVSAKENKDNIIDKLFFDISLRLLYKFKKIDKDTLEKSLILLQNKEIDWNGSIRLQVKEVDFLKSQQIGEEFPVVNRESNDVDFLDLSYWQEVDQKQMKLNSQIQNQNEQNIKIFWKFKQNSKIHENQEILMSQQQIQQIEKKSSKLNKNVLTKIKALNAFKGKNDNNEEQKNDIIDSMKGLVKQQQQQQDVIKGLKDIVSEQKQKEEVLSGFKEIVQDQKQSQETKEFQEKELFQVQDDRKDILKQVEKSEEEDYFNQSDDQKKQEQQKSIQKSNKDEKNQIDSQKVIDKQEDDYFNINENEDISQKIKNQQKDQEQIQNDKQTEINDQKQKSQNNNFINKEQKDFSKPEISQNQTNQLISDLKDSSNNYFNQNNSQNFQSSLKENTILSQDSKEELENYESKISHKKPQETILEKLEDKNEVFENIKEIEKLQNNIKKTKNSINDQKLEDFEIQKKESEKKIKKAINDQNLKIELPKQEDFLEEEKVELNDQKTESGCKC